MTAHPALVCWICGRDLPISAGVIGYLFNEEHLICRRCARRWHGDSRAAHAQHYPHCLYDWHDMWDHCCGELVRRPRSRARIAALASTEADER